MWLLRLILDILAFAVSFISVIFIYIFMLLLGPRAVALWQNAWVSVPAFGWLCVPCRQVLECWPLPGDIHSLPGCVLTVPRGCGEEHGE